MKIYQRTKSIVEHYSFRTKRVLFLFAVLWFLGTSIGCGPTRKQYQINEALLIDQTRVLENEVYRTRFLLKKCMEENDRLRQELGNDDSSTENESLGATDVPIKRRSELNVSASPSYKMQSGAVRPATPFGGATNSPVSSEPSSFDRSPDAGTSDAFQSPPGSQYIPSSDDLSLPLSQNQTSRRRNSRNVAATGVSQGLRGTETIAISSKIDQIPGVLRPAVASTGQNNPSLWKIDVPTASDQNQTSANSSDVADRSDVNRGIDASTIQNPVYRQTSDQNSDPVRPMNYESAVDSETETLDELRWSPLRQ